MANYLANPQLASSIASSQSGRISQQSYRRANEMRQFQRETIMTPGGFKTVRIYATADENQNLMNKYQQRPRTAIGIETSKNINKSKKHDNERLLQRAASTNELERSKTSDSNERPGNEPQLQPTPPSNQRPESRQMIYNHRHPSCTPTGLYLNDELRLVAKKHRQQRKSSQEACDECSSVERYNTVQKRKTKSTDSVKRFGSRVHCPKFVEKNPFITNDELDIGQKQYIWGMAKIYSVENMKSLRQRHYQSMLNYEYMKRVLARGVEKKDRIKIWKTYLEYQMYIDKFGKRGPKKLSKSTSPTKNTSHSHAKKHTAVGRTTDATDDSHKDSSSSDVTTSINDDSFIYTDDGTATDDGNSEKEQKELRNEKHNVNRNYGKDRPKSSKYKIRKPLASTKADGQKEMEQQDIKTIDTLSGEVADNLNLRSEDENFI